MENKELCAVLDSEIERVLYAMKSTRPESQDYGTILESVRELWWFKDSIINPRQVYTIEARHEDKPAEEPVKEEEVSFPEPVTEPVGEPEPPVVAESELTKESVRDLLKKKAAEGVLIQPIMEKFIPEGKPSKFSSIKASDYEALVKELNDAK